MRVLAFVLSFCLAFQPLWANPLQCQLLFSENKSSKLNPYEERLTDLREFMLSLEAIDALEVREQKFFSDLTKNILRNPDKPLTDIDLAKLSTNPKLLQFYKSFLSVLKASENSFRVVREGLRYLESPTYLHFFYERGISKKILRVAQAFYNGPMRFFIFLPRIQKPVDKVFQKQWKNPNYEPNEQEIQLLKDYKAEETFKEKKEFLNSHNGWHIFRKWLTVLIFSLMVSNTVLGINHDYHLNEGGSVAVSEYLKSPNYELKSNQVRIYNEGPIPHVAIEIGGSVYSYGVSHMTVKTRSQYLLEGLLQKAMAGKEIPKTEHASSLSPSKLLEIPKQAIESSGLSVQMITLNLTHAEHDQLRRYLELETGKRYRNHTFVTDCATMIAIALKNSTSININSLIDASPSWNLMYLSLLKSSGVKNTEGQPLVGNIFQVDRDDSKDRNKNLIRSSYLNIVEGRFALYLLPYNLAHRGYLEARYGTEGLHYWDPEVKAEIQKWNQAFNETFLESQGRQQIIVFEERVKRLVQSHATPEEIKYTISVIDAYFTEQILNEKRVLADANSKFYDLLQSAYRVQYFSQLSNSLKNQLQTGTITDSGTQVMDLNFDDIISHLKL